MEKAVKGATKVKLAAPKSKYVEVILAGTQGGEAGVADIFRTLQLRLRDSTWTIVFKALIVVHLMIREGASDVTLKYLSQSPKNLAISAFTEAQIQGAGIKRYHDYLLARVRAYRDGRTDHVRGGAGKMKQLTVDKGLLRQTEIIQEQIRVVLKCDLLGGHDPENEISILAFRSLTLDLLELFKSMNEGMINVLEHYFEMSRPDAERALDVYKNFARQTDQVVQFLSLARQYELYTKLEVPKLKHAPTTLTASLQDYLSDPDFEVNRRQYLAQQEAKRSGRAQPQSQTASTPFDRPAAASRPAATTANAIPTTQAKGPAPDLIDFFESIEQNQQPMVQNVALPQQQYNTGYAGPPVQQQFQQPQVPQGTGFNPFFQGQPQSQQTQPPPMQADFTGAGFGGYGPQPSQQPQTMPYAFSSQLTTIPQEGTLNFPQPQLQQQQQYQIQQTQMQAPNPALQPQHTSTNPFRQSMMPPPSPSSQVDPNTNRQSTNPFAQQSSSPLQPQMTGTNPFAKPQSPPPVNPLTVNVTGSTNPFRQSQFVSQSTGQGWQHSNQGTFAGFNMNNVETNPIFPRPGQG